MRLGVTGHQRVPDDLPNVMRSRIEAVGASMHDGVSCLAAGADQCFAALILEMGGNLDVVVPCAGYVATFESLSQREEYERLLRRSRVRISLPYPRPTESAYLAAGIVVVERCDLLIAVWDGRQARGLGGTGDVVTYAQSVGRPVEIISISRG